jgi:hypothetical protein
VIHGYTTNQWKLDNKEIGLYAQNIITSVGFKINIVGGLYATKPWAGET